MLRKLLISVLLVCTLGSKSNAESESNKTSSFVTHELRTVMTFATVGFLLLVSPRVVSKSKNLRTILPDVPLENMKYYFSSKDKINRTMSKDNFYEQVLMDSCWCGWEEYAFLDPIEEFMNRLPEKYRSLRFKDFMKTYDFATEVIENKNGHAEIFFDLFNTKHKERVLRWRSKLDSIDGSKEISNLEKMQEIEVRRLSSPVSSLYIFFSTMSGAVVGHEITKNGLHEE